MVLLSRRSTAAGDQAYVEKTLSKGLFTGSRCCYSTSSGGPHGIGLDVHQATISAAVRDSDGKLVLEAILETKAETMLQFIHGLRGSLHVTFEEGTSADWLYTLLKPHVTEVLVCDPRKNALLKVGNKGDRIDARKLSELLRANLLRAVFHDDTGLRTLREMARSYLTITKDVTRVMRRLKAIYRSWAIPCGGQQVYSPRHRAEWLGKITEASVRRRADSITSNSTRCVSYTNKPRKSCWPKAGSTTMKLLRQIPSIGPIRSVLLVAILQTPHRFRTKRQLWSYSGLALETRNSGEYRIEGGQLKRSKKAFAVRGLNKNS